MSTGGSVGCSKRARPLEIVRARRPREVVHVLLVVAMRRRAVAVVGARSRSTPVAPTIQPSGHGQRHVVDAEVGEELGARVELVAVPARVLQDAELGEPLRDEEEVADGAGARERARHMRGPRDLDRRARARRDRFGQRDSITVSSFGLSSSGATKRFAPVRSRPSAFTAVTSIRANSSAARGPRDPPASPRSRMNVVRLFFQAFQYR